MQCQPLLLLPCLLAFAAGGDRLVQGRRHSLYDACMGHGLMAPRLTFDVLPIHLDLSSFLLISQAVLLHSGKHVPTAYSYVSLTQPTSWPCEAANSTARILSLNCSQTTSWHLAPLLSSVSPGSYTTVTRIMTLETALPRRIIVKRLPDVQLGAMLHDAMTR